MKTLLTLFLIISLISCHKHDLTKELGQELTLCFNEKGVIIDQTSKLNLQFVKLIENSLCPEGAQCIWAGRAVVELKLNSTDIITLGVGDLISGISNAPYQNSIEYHDYKITLLKVDYTKRKHYGREDKCFITLRADKK